MHELLSITEENYLKAIYMLSEPNKDAVSTNAIALNIGTSAASVTDMLRRLTEKELTHYEKYKGVRLSPIGTTIATQLIRKHRLWETFMVDKLDFTWDEVHNVAEQLEHIQSEQLIDRLEAFLGFPRFDPHGDPIPDKNGNFQFRQQILISKLPIGSKAIIVGVNEHSPTFLQYVRQLQLSIGTTIEVLEKFPFDNSISLLINHNTSPQTISHKVCQNLFADTITI
jgi:DtxR family transcriptional regulator, Mn-dependent transcriptional regulator